MKDDDLKRPSVPVFNVNSLLAKPNLNLTKKPENSKDINKIKEDKASKFINVQNNKKYARSSYSGKNLIDQPKILQNISNKKKYSINSGLSLQSGKKYSHYSGYKKIMKKFNFQDKYTASEKSTKHKKRASVEKFVSTKIEENFRKDNDNVQKNFSTINSEHDQENEKEENKKLQVTMKENLYKKGEMNINQNPNKKGDNQKKENNNNEINIISNNLLYFKNDDEILKYIKNKVKDGKIENIYQKLELKNNDFSGYSISKKEKGYTIYEIQIEEDINKINELIKSQKILINNRQVQFVYTDELEYLKKTDEEYRSLKQETFLKVKNNYEQSIGMEKKENKFIKNNNDTNKNIKTNNISVESIFKIKKIENEEKENNQLPKKLENENKFVNSSSLSQIEEKKAKELEKEKKASKALRRFKKAFSKSQEKENEQKEEKKKEKDKNSGYSNKIHALAMMLKGHIKPINENEGKKESQEKIYRAGSVECRKSKIAESNMVKILENVPIPKKHVKKPKLNNFVNN